MKSVLVIIFFTSISIAQESVCLTEWVQENGKKYKPPTSLKTLYITFLDDADDVKLRTDNRTSYYKYKSFLDIDGKFGISYGAANGNILDIFEDGQLVIWSDNIALLKASCSKLELKIGKIK